MTPDADENAFASLSARNTLSYRVSANIRYLLSQTAAPKRCLVQHLVGVRIELRDWAVFKGLLRGGVRGHEDPLRARCGAYIPRSADCDNGPLTTGGCAGGGSGAGIRFSKTGICGAGAPMIVEGSRTKLP